MRDLLTNAFEVYCALIPLGWLFVYWNTDYSKIKASTLCKIEATIMLGALWPFCVLYLIKNRKRSNNDKTKEV